MTSLDDERSYCYKDDLILYTKEQRWSDETDSLPSSVGAVSTGPPAPPVGEFDVWIPILWLLGILFFGFIAWFIGIIVLISATIYVYYNSKKFNIGGGLTILTLLFAIVGLPLYSWDLYKLKQKQETTPAPPQPAPTPPIRPESGQQTKFCRNCGAKIPRLSKFCQECGTNLT